MSGHPDPRYAIRMLARDEVALAIDWAAAEGWNPGLHDAASFYAADPGGFLVGTLDGAPIATISVVEYGPAFGFLGLYIVQARHRGHGYGLALWNAGIARLGARTIGLDGVVAQQANYRRSGFELAYRNVRYEGRGGAAAGHDPRIVPLATRPLDEVIAYDARMFAAPRPAFVASWIAQPQCTALGIVLDRRLAGYGVVRAARSGWKIGPLFADAPALADALLDRLAAAVPASDALYLDVSEINRAAVALAERRDMTIVFETARMYAGPAPAVPTQCVFGVTSFELG